jgi:hypothetical protein
LRLDEESVVRNGEIEPVGLHVSCICHHSQE